MKILLIGPPNTGKRHFAGLINKHLTNKKRKPLLITPKPEDQVIGAAVGELSDYRSETLLAAYRATLMGSETDCIFVHSLVDSVAHLSARFSTLKNLNILDEQWTYSLLLSVFMLNDTFQYDIAVKFPFDGEDDSFFNSEVSKALDVLIEDLEINLLEPNIDVVKDEIERLSKTN